MAHCGYLSESRGKYQPIVSLGVEGKDERDVLALVAYDGSVHEDKKATIVECYYHSRGILLSL